MGAVVSSSATKHASSFRHPILGPVALAGVPLVVLGFGRFGYTLILQSMRATLHWSYGLSGLAAAANCTGYLIGAMWAPSVIGFAGVSRSAVLGVVLTAVTIGSMALNSGIVWVLIVRFGSGLFGGVALVAGNVIAATLQEGTHCPRTLPVQASASSFRSHVLTASRLGDRAGSSSEQFHSLSRPPSVGSLVDSLRRLHRHVRRLCAYAPQFRSAPHTPCTDSGTSHSRPSPWPISTATGEALSSVIRSGSSSVWPRLWRERCGLPCSEGFEEVGRLQLPCSWLRSPSWYLWRYGELRGLTPRPSIGPRLPGPDQQCIHHCPARLSARRLGKRNRPPDDLVRGGPMRRTAPGWAARRRAPGTHRRPHRVGDRASSRSVGRAARLER
jgi:hypothetical protein